MSWLGLSGTGCHGWDCQGLLVMAGIVRLVVMAGTRGAGCHGWDCQGIREQRVLKPVSNGL